MRIICLVFVMQLSISFAQDAPSFYLFRNNQSTFNPAATGLHHRTYAAVNYQHLYPSLSGSFKNITALADLRVTDRHAVGFNYMHSGTPVNTILEQSATINYAYHYPLSQGKRLSIGLGLGTVRKRIDFTKIYFSPSIPNQDDIIIDYFYNVNLGISFQSKRLLIGGSTRQLIEQEGTFFRLRRQYYFNAAYKVKLTRKWLIEPNVLFGSDGDYSTVDLNIMATYNNKIWFGYTLRPQDGGAGMVGFDLKRKLRLGYAYGYSVSNLSNVSGGVHEFVLALKLR